MFSRRLVVCGFIFALACSDSGEPPTGPRGTASVTGVVREQGNNAPVSGAVVTIGGMSANSGADGQFTLVNVPVAASVTMAVTAPGFDQFTQKIAIQSGANSVSVALVRNWMYEAGAVLVYLPPTVTTYRGVFFVLMGATADSRPLIRGDLAYYESLPLSGDVSAYRAQLLTFARTHGLAIMGARFTSPDKNPATYTAILEALNTISVQSGHAELRTAPFMLHGHSLGGCIAYEFAVLHPTRAIGFIAAKAPCLALDGSTAVSVPGYLFLGENDPLVPPSVAAAVVTVFEQNRQRGALWALAVEPGSNHTQVADLPLMFNWMSDVVMRRLTDTPAPGESGLRTVSQLSGWVGDNTSLDIAAYGCYSGDKLKASWLPSEQTARDWQRMVSGGGASRVSCF